MALAIDASTPAYVGTAGTAVSAQTTAAFTPPVGALLVVLYASFSDATLQTAPTNTGGTVSWDAAAKVTEAANTCAASIWLGTVTTSASMTVTAHRGTSAQSWGFGVAVLTGQATAPGGGTQVATSTSGAPSATIAALTGANSLVLASIANFTNNTLPTVPAGQSDTFNAHAFQFQDNTNVASGWAQYLTGINLPAGASATINDTAPTIDYSLAMLEILAASAAPPTVGPVPVFLPSNTLGRGVRNQGQMTLFRERSSQPPAPAATPTAPAWVPTYISPNGTFF